MFTPIIKAATLKIILLLILIYAEVTNCNNYIKNILMLLIAMVTVSFVVNELGWMEIY